MMDAKSFFILVLKLRTAQREYFKYRSYTALNQAKMLEKQVDDEIERTQREIRELELNF